MIDQEKLQTVAHLTAAGRSQRAIEAETGIPKTTVKRYQHRPEAAQIINELRPQILATLSEKLYERVTSEDFHPKDTDLTIMYGIVHDKYIKAEAPQSSNPTLVIVIPGINQPDIVPDYHALGPESGSEPVT